MSVSHVTGRYLPGGGRPDGTAARLWAVGQGIPVNMRGRVTAAVFSAWRDAGSPGATINVPGYLRRPSKTDAIRDAVLLVTGMTAAQFNAARSSRRCALCGIQVNNQSKTSICRSNPECKRINVSIHNLVSRRLAKANECAQCGKDWLKTNRVQYLCPACEINYFWCCKSNGIGGHVSERKYQASKSRCKYCRLLLRAYERAIERRIDFALTREYIASIWNDVCPYLGIPLSHGTGVLHMASPTLDRINLDIGYVPGNVEIVSFQANSMKMCATPEQLIRFAREVLRRYE